MTDNANSLLSSQSFCDGDCQRKMLTSGLLISLIVGIFTSVFLAITLCRTFCNFTIPNVQEKILFFVMYIFVLISWNCLSIPFAGDDFPTILDLIRRVFQIVAYISFYQMTCNYITQKKTIATLQMQLQGRHLFPFNWCLRAYQFATPDLIQKSLKRIDYYVYQAVVIQAIAGCLDVAHDLTGFFDSSNAIVSSRTKEWFNLGYLIAEALSVTIGAYFIFLRFSFNKLHYRHTHFRLKFTIFMILLVLANWQWIALEAMKNKIFVTFFQLKDRLTEDHLAVCLNSLLISVELLFCALFSQVAFNPKEFLNEELRSLTREENVLELSPVSRETVFSEPANFALQVQPIMTESEDVSPSKSTKGNAKLNKENAKNCEDAVDIENLKSPAKGSSGHKTPRTPRTLKVKGRINFNTVTVSMQEQESP